MLSTLESKYISNLMGLDSKLLGNNQNEDLPCWLTNNRTILFNCARQALYHGYKLLNLPKNSYVLVPLFICNTVTVPLTLAGAKLIYYKINESLQPDFAHIKSQINFYGKENCKAMLWYHYLGFNYGMLDTKNFCEENNLIFIEDASHTLPITHKSNGINAGEFGDLAVFSIRKTLPVIQAGALQFKNENKITEFNKNFRSIDNLYNNKNKIKKNQLCDLYSSLKNNNIKLISEFKDKHVEYVKNINSSDAIIRESARSEIKNSDISEEFISEPYKIDFDSMSVIQKSDINLINYKRQKNYQDLFLHLNQWALFKELPVSVMPLGFSICIENRDELRLKLAVRGIESTTHWPDWLLPMPLSSEFKNEIIFANQLLTLPIHQDLNADDINYIGEAVKEILN